FVINAPADWHKRGTVWSCKYHRSGTARGIHFIHPIDQGHVLVAIATGGIAAGSIQRWPGGDPSPFGPDTAMQLDWKIDPAKLVLDLDEPHELQSELTADGMLQVHVDGKLVASGRVAVVHPLELT